MTELKTLKEIREIKFHGYAGLVFKEDLRAEAVKWIKEMRKDFALNCNGLEEKRVISGQITFIKHFFNLTEEELK